MNTKKAQKIIPNLWFDSEGEEAAEFYTSLFEDSAIGEKTHYGKEGHEIHGQPEGKVMTVEFELEGVKFIALNGGPHFTFTPAISFFVVCDTEEEVDRLWYRLSEGGSVLMELDKYEWSNKYGWLQDKYGLSWQLYQGDVEQVGQKICPSLMFVGEQQGRAEEAINAYTSIFEDSGIMGIMHYEDDDEDEEGTVKHAQFNLMGQQFMAMDSSMEHNFGFNEAISFLITCDSQDEIDYYWEKLSEDGDPEAQQCGWLKDKFGVSWQVVPEELSEMMSDSDPEKVARVTNCFLKMKKLDLQELQAAYQM